MPVSQLLLAEFSEESYYHIICKCINGKRLFYTDDNRRYFLSKYHDLLEQFLDTYAYVLLDNHVHWLVRIKREEEITESLTLQKPWITKTQKKFLSGDCDLHELIEQQFHRLFISYALALNKRKNQQGHLFNRPFRRIEIEDNFHLLHLIIYIHANVKRHQLQKDFSLYKWSSYPAMLSSDYTPLKREEVLELFGGRKRFIELHKNQAEHYYEY